MLIMFQHRVITRFVWWGVILLVCGGPVQAQFSAERSGFHQLENSKWEKARAQFKKAMRKDSLNPVARYGLARYYFTPSNPDFQIDSAYAYVMAAWQDYSLSAVRDRERMRRFPLDSARLVHLREQIDSAAFERAKQLHTEAGYNFFLSRFPLASQRELAGELRDEVAYLDALRINTYVAFRHYLDLYPQSARADEALRRYHKLLFEGSTKDKKLESYQRFLEAHPETPHRAEVERVIFEIMTAPGTIESLDRYLQQYASASMSTRARQLLYHVYDFLDVKMPESFLQDSLRRVQQLDRQILTPFLEGDRFGLMDHTGAIIMRASWEELPEEYRCGGITDELLVGRQQVLSRSGHILFEGPVDACDDLGLGFVLVESDACQYVLHKTGWKLLPDCVEDARVVGSQFIAVKQASKWSLFALNGRPLMTSEWDDIFDVSRRWVVFRKGERLYIPRREVIAGMANQGTWTVVLEADEVKPWPGQRMWLRRGEEQSIVNSDFSFWIPWQQQVITPEWFGAISHLKDGYHIHFPRTTTSGYAALKLNRPWIAARERTSWRLIDASLQMTIPQAFDSVSFVGPFALTLRNDSLRVYMQQGMYIMPSAEAKLEFVPGKDSTFFLLVQEGDKKIIYNPLAQRVATFTGYDRVEYAGEQLWQVTRRDKKGLLSQDGKVVLAVDLDALGAVQQQQVAMLRNKRFGLADVARKKEIKPVYDKNVVSYNSATVIVVKDGKTGLVDWNNKPVSGFEFDEVQFWNDSIALVRRDFRWQLYHLRTRKIMLDKVDRFSWVINTAREKIMIIHQDGGYGVISNTRGEIIPATFSNIVNVGTATEPIYFTEKHVEEAAIYVVIYYDKNGRQLRRQVFEADDFERIDCRKKG